MSKSVPAVNIHSPKLNHGVAISLQEFNRQQQSPGGEGPPSMVPAINIHSSKPSHAVAISLQELNRQQPSKGEGPLPMVRIHNPLLSTSFLSGEKGGLAIPHNLFFPGSDLRPPRNRKPNYSENEKQLFFALIGPHVDILDAKSQERQIMNMKTEIWKEITMKYNEIISKLNGNYVCRDSEELKTFWKNVRRSNRRKSSYDIVPDLNERLGMEGSSSSNKNEGASSSFLTCSPLISSMPGIHEDVMSSGAGPSSSAQNSNENEGDYEEDAIDVKSEPAFNVESEICEEENSQSNTQSSSDRRSHQSSPTPSMIGPYLLKKETHCTTILDQLLRDDTFSDVTLTAEGQSIRAHKIVLCLASAYFRQVLSKESNVQNVIVFRDVKFAELKNLINFIYTGEATVDAADLESFMKTAEMLEVTSLCDGQRNFPKNLLPRTRESETEKTPSSTPSKATFPSTKRSHTFSSAASNGSPPTKSRKTDGKDSSKKSSVIPHPSTSGGGSGTSVPNNSIIEPMTIIKTEPVSEDSVADEDYELRVGADVSFESLTRSPPPLTQPSQVSTDLDENQSPSSDQSPSSSTSLEKVPVGKCPLCPISQPTRNGSEMTKHLYSQHPDKTVFCCESCSRVFLKKGSFEAHKNDCAR